VVEAFAAFGKINVLVNNAAYAYMGAIEESR
jgi:NAD(P)-dependent dehydrogenase (short-subunit alcohol dehydrogenase family)